ncbi:MAG: hypothetical protein JWR39_2131, partial [Devosia sp.]|nr:hypothetical protein [Devosia sp.]
TRLMNPRSATALLLAALLDLALVLGTLPLWCGGVYGAAGLLSFWLYRRDKAAAQAGNWRVSETTLYAFDACGGIIGGLLAQQHFRHKTRKQRFAATTLVIALLHLLWLGSAAMGLVAFAWP